MPNAEAGMKRIEVLIKDAELPEEAEPMARLTLSTGSLVELTLTEWRELIAKLELGGKK